jgi:hypothetical protein
MDVSFLKSLLENMGPVYVPAYDETVSAKNFYLLVQSHAENDFFPGSSQKKDFLQHVAQALILSLQDREQLPFLGLVKAVDQAVSQKHMMVTSATADLRTLFAKNNFAPSVLPNETERQATLSDFVGVFDANVGANKANYYIKRDITQDMVMSSTGARTGTTTISYTNTSTKDSPFGGDYKNYIRMVLPETAVITGITTNGRPQTLVPAVTSERVYTSDRFVPPAGLELEEEIRYGRKLTGFFIIVPMGLEIRVSVNYSIPQDKPLPESLAYVLRIFKQPGTDYDPYHLTFTYPPDFTLTKAPGFTAQSGHTLRVATQLAEDIVLPLKFTK